MQFPKHIATALLTCLALSWSTAYATDYTWVGGSSSAPTSWDAPDNWSPFATTLPGANPSDTATFPASANTFVVEVPNLTGETLASITTLAPYTFMIDSGARITLTGILSGSPNITVNGILQFNNTSSASSSVINGTGIVQFSDFATANQASIGSNGVFDVSGMLGPLTVGALYGSGAINLGASSLSIGSLSLNAVLSGPITGSGGLTKVGAGTLTLSGSSSNFTGSTLVATGALDVTGQIASTVTVSLDTKLSGSGTVDSIVNSGTLAPTGTLTVIGSLSEQTSAVTDLSTSGDVLSVTGFAVLGGALHIAFPGGPPSPGTTYLLINSSGVSGVFATCTTDTPGEGVLAYTATQVTFTTPAVEEIFANGFETPLCN